MPEIKTVSAPAEKMPIPSVKPGEVKPAPTTAEKKSDAPAKPAEVKPAPAATEKKADTPAKPAEGKSAPAATEKKPDAPAKPGEVKAAPAATEKKPDAPAKPGEVKPAPAATEKKADAPAKPAEVKPTPTATEKKPDTPAKPAEVKAAPAATEKKSDSPAKPAEVKPAPTATEKKSNAPAKSAGAKTAKAGETDLLGNPVKQEKAADPKTAKKDTAVEPPKGIQITQVLSDRLDAPGEKELRALPVPKEGEAYSMRLHPGYFFEFLEHPFSINREVADYKDLYDSIKLNGINEPVKARPRKDGGLELLSGHRRHDIAKQLNYPVPVVIVQEDDDTARIEVVDGNLHRQDIPTSELARAAKMKMDALTRKAGRRTKMEKLTGPSKRTDQQVAEDMGMSRNQVNRLVRIDALVPELKQQVDDKKLPFNTAVELSYLKPEEQNNVVEFIKKEQVVPSMAQATALKDASREAAKQEAENKAKGITPAPAAKTATQPTKPAASPVDSRKISSIVKPKTEPEQKYTFTSSEIKDYFPGDKYPTVSEVKRTIFEALDMRQRSIERKKAKEAVKEAAKAPAR